MSHKPNRLSWDQDVAASPREFHETDNNRTNSAALLATLQYFSFRYIRFSKLLSYQKLSQIIVSYFSNALSFEQGKRSFQLSGKLTSFEKNNEQKNARHFENHWFMTWRHTGSDQSTNVHPWDAPSLLILPLTPTVISQASFEIQPTGGLGARQLMVRSAKVQHRFSVIFIETPSTFYSNLSFPIWQHCGYIVIFYYPFLECD